MNKRKIGNVGEMIACQFLEQNGFHILNKNVYIGRYEIDIIAVKCQEIYFIEVKYRASLKFGYPIEAMTPQKCMHFKKAVASYINNYKRGVYDKQIHLSFLGILKCQHSYDYQWVKDFFT